MDRYYTVSVKPVSRHSDSKKMNNSEAAFTLSSVMEFIKVWRVGNESSLILKCKDGRASINFHCNLGRPDQAHTQDGRQRHQKVKKKKSASRVLKNNARAARHQAASRPSLPVFPTQPGTATSPVPVTSRTVTIHIVEFPI